jgi:phenylalanine-4-hydroxylase
MQKETETLVGSSTDQAKWKLVSLDSDHPGFRDHLYRKRREEIAHIAINWDPNTNVPDAPYSEEEHAVWHSISSALFPLHNQWACEEVLRCRDCLKMSLYRIPQLSDINSNIFPATKFKMAPVAGLVSSRDFLKHMSKNTFLSTQYIRHHSRPWYTPEPDIVHELIGHAPSLLDPYYAELNRNFGYAATQANDARMLELERIYWYTLEFGVVRQGGLLKAYGAGLLSSKGELERFATCAELVPFNLSQMALRPYNPTDFQNKLFVADNIEQIIGIGHHLTQG